MSWFDVAAELKPLVRRGDTATRVTLTGLERLQNVCASPAFADPALRQAAQLCSPLVVCKFQDLIQKAVPLMTQVKVPVLATGHGYDVIAEFQPSR